MPVLNTNISVTAIAALVAAFVAAPVFLTAVAHAEPDPDAPVAPVVDPKAACEAPDVGGVFVTTTTAPDPVSLAQCQYIVEGYFYYDTYENGTYTGTLVYKDGAKVPTPRPQIPGLLDVPGGMPMVVFPGQF